VLLSGETGRFYRGGIRREQRAADAVEYRRAGRRSVRELAPSTGFEVRPSPLGKFTADSSYRIERVAIRRRIGGQRARSDHIQPVTRNIRNGEHLDSLAGRVGCEAAAREAAQMLAHRVEFADCSAPLEQSIRRVREIGERHTVDGAAHQAGGTTRDQREQDIVGAGSGDEIDRQLARPFTTRVGNRVRGLTERHRLQIDRQPIRNDDQPGRDPISDYRFERASHRAGRFANGKYDQARARPQGLARNLDLVSVAANRRPYRMRGIHRFEGSGKQLLEPGSGEPFGIHGAGGPSASVGGDALVSASAGGSSVPDVSSGSLMGASS